MESGIVTSSRSLFVVVVVILIAVGLIVAYYVLTLPTASETPPVAPNESTVITGKISGNDKPVIVTIDPAP